MSEAPFEWLFVARTLTAQAGELIRESKNIVRTGENNTKSSSVDIVTEFDRRAEKIILDGIRARYPEHGIISEESHTDGKLETVTWIVDPIDGTTNFIAGLSDVAVSVGVAVEGVVKVGVIYNPIREETFYSVRGFGAFLNDKPISVNRNINLNQ
mmetsp:Transcript_6023/g.18149  ORF Transcript_6023/g.18149 Transcript_6023/m.18149 type:complete len:155 (-) Transcript_6023:2215-2679(-)